MAIIQSVVSSISVKILGNFGSLVQCAVSGPLMLGFAGMALRAARGGSPQFPDLFLGFQRFLPAFLANLIITILTFIGCLLCILPGIFVGMIYCLTWFYMSDRKLDFWPSMEASRQKVMESIGSWVPIFLVVVLLVIAGALLCGVGLLVTVPIAFVMLALAFDQANGGSGSVSPIEDDYQANV